MGFLIGDIKDWLKLSPVKEIREAAANKFKEQMGDKAFEITKINTFYCFAKKKNDYKTDVFIHYKVGGEEHLEEYYVNSKTFEVTELAPVTTILELFARIQKMIDEW